MAKGGKGRRRRGVLLLLVLGLLALTAFSGQRWVLARLEPANPASQEMLWVEIASGMNTADVAQTLFEHGLIKDPTVFRYYVRYRRMDSQIISGEYQLSPAMKPQGILDLLTRGQVRTRRITVPEGLTLSMMADLFARQKLMTREQFLAAARQLVGKNPHLPANQSLTQPMEGYLFPATYEFRQNAQPAEMVGQMLERFQQVWTPELQKRAKELGLSVHQVLSLASIVELEAVVPAERPRIAGVYLNRLAIDMALQADPTVYYALSLPRGERLLYKHLEVDSPYNTYKYPGLPPGPIAAPGEESIKAVLYPEKHQFYYFVAKEDGSGEHYFSQTLEEHNEMTFKAQTKKGQ